MDLLLAAVAVTSLAATWFFCLRPMWKGRCGMSGHAGSSDEKLSRQIAELQEEIRMLRAQDALGKDRSVRRDDVGADGS
jgi:hypothetical protein